MFEAKLIVPTITPSPDDLIPELELSLTAHRSTRIAQTVPAA